MAEPVYVHHIRVRYGEVDMQGVVFNAHYLAYIDDASDTWLRSILGQFENFGWEPMVVRAVLDLQGGARLGNVVDIALRVSRWGRTSFDIEFTGTVGPHPIFTSTITYVGVSTGDLAPMEPPDVVRTALAVT